jgi:uncharacterized delta-60 repeat protein
VGASLSVQADGRILVADYSYNSSGNLDFSVIRLNADGTLDTSFIGDGKATVDVGGYYDYGQSLTVQADGKIVVAGVSDSDFGVIRISADGTLDATFGALASGAPNPLRPWAVQRPTPKGRRLLCSTPAW